MLTEAQKKTAEAIINIFETSSARGNYGDVTLIKGDTGHLTYGRSQGSLTSGDLHNIIKAYCDAPGAQLAGKFRAYLSRLSAHDLSLDNDMPFRALLKQAGDDPVMHTVQDAFFDRSYWQPATAVAARMGITLPLGVAVVYDSHIHGSWKRMHDRTHESVNMSAGEQAWIRAYVQTRRDWLANHSRADLRATVYRMKAFQALIEQEKWDLALPMTIQSVLIDHKVLKLSPTTQTAGTRQEESKQQAGKQVTMAHPIEKVAMKRNFYKSRGELPVSLVIIHYTAGHEQGDLSTLIGATDREVSVHYLIGRKPSFGIKAIVPEDKTAWHCGVSKWQDHRGVERSGVNSFSIGIEISNMGPPEPYTDFQYEATAQLAREIMARHPHITLERFVGHEDISPGRKVDPGPHWDWERFRRMVREGADVDTTPLLKVILLADNSVIECNPRLEDERARVDMRAVCSALDIALPTGEALAALRPEVIPPGITRVNLRPLAESNGWEVLTHRMAEDSKIYLRKKA